MIIENARGATTYIGHDPLTGLRNSFGMILPDLPQAFFKQVSAEFNGETILWAGRPSPSMHFWQGIQRWLFGILATVFGLIWQALSLAVFFDTGVGKVVGPGGWLDYIFPVLGLPFLMIGLGMMSVPFRAWWNAKDTVHVLTERRLATVIAHRNFNVTSIAVDHIASVNRTENRNGKGNLKLSLGEYRDSDGDLIEKKTEILGVSDVRELERLIIKMMTENTKI